MFLSRGPAGSQAGLPAHTCPGHPHFCAGRPACPQRQTQCSFPGCPGLGLFGHIFISDSPTGHHPDVPQANWGAPCLGHWGAPASLTPAVSVAYAEGSPAEADACSGQRSASSTGRPLGQNFSWLSSAWCIVPEALGSDGTLLTRHPALWPEAE